jgi:signal transduction histidine kinase
MLERARAWWRRERHAIPEPRPRPVQRREHGPVLPAVAAFVDRAEAAVPPGRWRALLLGPVVGLLWFATSYQALRGVPDGAVDPVALVTGLTTVPLLARRRAPLWSWLVIAVGVAILSGAHPVLPAGAVISLLVALYTIGVRCGRVISTGAGVLSGLALLPMVGNEFRSGVPLPLPLTLSLVVAVLALADQVGTRRLTEQALADAAEASRREQARRAVLEERSRIARELHDVVAHHMSMVAVQAETAPYRLSGLPEEGVRDFAAIGETAREALNEMRRLLGVLRSDAEPAERAPQPGLGHLGELVDGARGAGLPATMTVTGEPRPLPAGVELSAYRIVQEALSNAARHAAGAATVGVEVGYEPDRLLVSVTDDGPGPARPPGPDAHGLLGMSERVAMLGGSFEAGPGPDGGFRVSATLPIREAQA